MRMIYNVIDQMLAEIPEHEHHNYSNMIKSLQRTRQTALYKAPEQMPQYFEMVSITLSGHLGDPTGIAWKEKIRDIFADRMPPAKFGPQDTPPRHQGNVTGLGEGSKL